MNSTQWNVHRYSLFVDSRVSEDVSERLQQIASADAVIRPTYTDKEVEDDDDILDRDFELSRGLCLCVLCLERRGTDTEKILDWTRAGTHASGETEKVTMWRGRGCDHTHQCSEIRNH